MDSISKDLFDRKSFEMNGVSLDFTKIQEELEKNRGTIKIYIGFSGTNSAISKIIKKVQKTPFSHTYLKYNIGDKTYVFEADWKGTVQVEYEKWSRIKASYIRELELEITDGEFLDLLDFIIQNVRKPYDYAQLVWILFKWKVSDNGPKRYICSELVARALQTILMIEENELDQFTPRHLFEHLVRIGYISEDDTYWKKRIYR